MAKLTKIMARMYKDSIEHEKHVTITLGHGLRIELSVVFGQVVLWLSRKDIAPSLQEWETVLKSFPYLPRDPWGRRPAIEQEWVNPQGWHVIRGAWAIADMRDTEGMEWVT